MGTEDNVVRFVIGVFVSLAASFMDALGLNVLKLDHVKEARRDKEHQRGDCGRPLWHLGLYTYIASQLIGSTIALNYLKTQWVAPLGSVALIFNFVFAKILVNTKITRKDVLGTCVVVASVIWIVVFGGMYNGEDPEEQISVESLKVLFVRPIFIIYFSALNIIAFGGLFISIWSNWAISDETRKKKIQLFANMNQKKMKHIVGLMFSIEGGVLASETLLLAKSGVKLFTLSIKSQVNQFNDNASRFILLALLITAILQVYCLNTALKLYSSVVVVPVFYGTYTALGLVNTIIYLDEIGNYPPWAIVLVFVGIGVLIYGVFLLSSKPDPAAHLSDDEEADHSGQQELEHTSNWLSAKEEKEIVDTKATAAKSIIAGEGVSASSSAFNVPAATDNNKDSGAIVYSSSGRITQFFRRLRYSRYNPHNSFTPPRREMDTFISLNSSAGASAITATMTGTPATTNDHIIPLAITSTATTADGNSTRISP
ncbi:magnesium transporter NIPA-domain-containing protein [Parasitella parasitica]|nr:magnesium transporter NIPA-domain-containing protein [Parasitella parasitica]